MSVVFWDTMLFIYLVEKHPVFNQRVKEVRRRMLTRHDQLLTSVMTLGELLAGPSARADSSLAETYRKSLTPPFCGVVPFTVDTAEHYGKIRADRTILPADAIQLACAAEAKVDLFLTNDRRLSKKIVPGIQFIADLDFDYL